MNNHITRRQVVDRLTENGIPFAIVPLQSDVSIVLSQRGGRVLGPFLSEEGESLFWTPAPYGDAAAFRDFLASGHWNAGGDRVWIAPEVQYNPKGSPPPASDPGTWALDQLGASQWRLQQSMTVEAFNLASGSKELHIERRLRPAPDPLRYLPDAARPAGNLLYAGYEQEVTLSEGRQDEIMSESWSIAQLNPGGQMIVPASPASEPTLYLGRGDLMEQRGNAVHLSITGDAVFKFGFCATGLTGRFGYVNSLADGRAYLLARAFFPNPSALYVDVPGRTPDRRGDAVHIYNDGGRLGGFGEMEYQGRAIGGETESSRVTDISALWLYVGEPRSIAQVTEHLLGIAPTL